MTAAVFPKDQASFGNADRLRVDDFVGGLFLQVAVLMDAGLMRECVFPDDGFVGLRAEADEARQRLAGRIQMFSVNAGLKGIVIVTGLHHHDHFFERAVPGPLTNAVDGAFNLPRSSLHRSQGVRYGQTQIIVTVDADDGAVTK